MLFTPRRAARLAANVPNLYRIRFRHTDFRTPSVTYIQENTSDAIYQLLFPGLSHSTAKITDPSSIPDAFTGLPMQRLAQVLEHNTVVIELILDQILAVDFDIDALCRILSSNQSLQRVTINYPESSRDLNFEKVFTAIANITRPFLLTLNFSPTINIDWQQFETLLVTSNTKAAIKLPAGVFFLRDGNMCRETPQEYSARIKAETETADQSIGSLSSSQSSLDQTWESLADQSQWKRLNKAAVRDLLTEFDLLKSKYAPEPVPIYPLLQFLFELREEMDEQSSKNPELLDVRGPSEQKLIRTRFGMLRPEKMALRSNQVMFSTSIYATEGRYQSFYPVLEQKVKKHLGSHPELVQSIEGILDAEVTFLGVKCTGILLYIAAKKITISHCSVKDSLKLLAYANSCFSELQQPNCKQRREKIANCLYALIHAQILRGGMAACCEMFEAFLQSWKKFNLKYQNRHARLPMDLSALFEFNPSAWAQHYIKHCRHTEDTKSNRSQRESSTSTSIGNVDDDGPHAQSLSK